MVPWEISYRLKSSNDSAPRVRESHCANTKGSDGQFQRKNLRTENNCGRVGKVCEPREKESAAENGTAYSGEQDSKSHETLYFRHLHNDRRPHDQNGEGAGNGECGRRRLHNSGWRNRCGEDPSCHRHGARNCESGQRGPIRAGGGFARRNSVRLR